MGTSCSSAPCRAGAPWRRADLARELGRRLGVPVEFVSFDTAGKLGDGVKTGVWDVAFLGAEPSARPRSPSPPPTSRSRRPISCRPARRSARSPRSTARAFGSPWPTRAPTVSISPAREAREARVDEGLDASFEVFVADKLEALAGLKPRLLTDVQKLTGRAGARRAVHRGPAGDRHTEGPRGRREVSARVRRGREGLGTGGAGDLEARGSGRHRRAARAVPLVRKSCCGGAGESAAVSSDGCLPPS